MRKYISFPEIPDQERAIGARVREARRQARLGQAKLAALIGLSRDQVNNVEIGRVALRFRPGWDLCVELDLNPAWLLTGEGDHHGLVVVGGMDQVSDDDLFTEVMGFVYEEDFPSWPGYVKYREENLKGLWSIGVFSFVKPDTFRHPPVKLGREAKSRETIPLAGWRKQISPERHADFLRFMHRSARAFIRANDRKRVELLTNQLRFGKVGSMKLRKALLWPALRERALKLVRQRGMKSVLASDIGVSRQAVNALLGRKGTYGPSAEYALRLSKWVEMAEAKQKQSGGRVSEARPLRKIRNRKKRSKPNHELLLKRAGQRTRKGAGFLSH